MSNLTVVAILLFILAFATEQAAGYDGYSPMLFEAGGVLAIVLNAFLKDWKKK